MPYEQVDILMPSGQRHGPADWATLCSWVQQGVVPPDATVVDRATGQQQLVSGFREFDADRAAPYSAYNSPAHAGGRSDDGVATIIPYRNMPALVGYYLGVFSFLSCVPVLGILGIGMGVAAAVLGVIGLKKVNANPQAKGTAHAWIAIVCGTLFTLCGVVIHVLFIGGMMASRR